MGLIILIVAGALLGWLATIALRVETGREILKNVLAGTLGSLVLGVATSGGILLGSIRASSLLYALFGAIAFIALYNFVRRKALP